MTRCITFLMFLPQPSPTTHFYAFSVVRRTQDKPGRYVANTVVDTVDWYVKLDSVTLVDVNNILLPTCLSTAWWLTIGWMCGAKLAAHEITFDLGSLLTVSLPVLL